MIEKKTFILAHDTARTRAAEYAMAAPDGWHVTFRPPTRSLDQNARFHAICGDIATAGIVFAGKKRSLAQWKVLIVSGHAAATNEGAEIVPGIESEFVNLRESTALMSVKRSASLIEYATAYAVHNGVRLNDHGSEAQQAEQ